MTGESAGRKRTEGKVWRFCQKIPDTRQRSADSQPMARRRWVAWKFLFLVLFLSLAGCGWFESEEFPKELLGRWVTDNPKYQGCYMKIDENAIVFNASDSNLYVSTIKKVETDIEFGRKVHHIIYTDKEDIEYLLSVIVLKGSKTGRLQFYNQRYLEWNKMDLSREEP